MFLNELLFKRCMFYKEKKMVVEKNNLFNALEFYFISFFLALGSELNRNNNDRKLCTIPLFFRALLIAIDENVHLGVDSSGLISTTEKSLHYYFEFIV